MSSKVVSEVNIWVGDSYRIISFKPVKGVPVFGQKSTTTRTIIYLNDCAFHIARSSWLSPCVFGT